jgi:hypothetical protein
MKKFTQLKLGERSIIFSLIPYAFLLYLYLGFQVFNPKLIEVSFLATLFTISINLRYPIFLVCPLLAIIFGVLALRKKERQKYAILGLVISSFTIAAIAFVYITKWPGY